MTGEERAIHDLLKALKDAKEIIKDNVPEASLSTIDRDRLKAIREGNLDAGLDENDGLDEWDVGEIA